MVQGCGFVTSFRCEDEIRKRREKERTEICEVDEYGGESLLMVSYYKLQLHSTIHSTLSLYIVIAKLH